MLLREHRAAKKVFLQQKSHAQARMGLPDMTCRNNNQNKGNKLNQRLRLGPRKQGEGVQGFLIQI